MSDIQLTEQDKFLLNSNNLCFSCKRQDCKFRISYHSKYNYVSTCANIILVDNYDNKKKQCQN